MDRTLPIPLAVAVGGALGSLGRWALAETAGGVSATLLVNATGALAMGLLVAWLQARSAPAWVRPAIATGLLGGWTTYSGFALDALSLTLTGAVAYLAATVVLALGGCLLGLVVGERVFADDQPPRSEVAS